jgi:hypothetical protein
VCCKVNCNFCIYFYTVILHKILVVQLYLFLKLSEIYYLPLLLLFLYKAITITAWLNTKTKKTLMHTVVYPLRCLYRNKDAIQPPTSLYDSATSYSTHTCSTQIRFNCLKDVFIFSWGQYMCCAPERLSAFGARTSALEHYSIITTIIVQLLKPLNQRELNTT